MYPFNVPSLYVDDYAPIIEEGADRSISIGSNYDFYITFYDMH
jgi:hypothetical protein